MTNARKQHLLPKIWEALFPVIDARLANLNDPMVIRAAYEQHRLQYLAANQKQCCRPKRVLCPIRIQSRSEAGAGKLRNEVARSSGFSQAGNFSGSERPSNTVSFIPKV